jgi:hypothetical protein
MHGKQIALCPSFSNRSQLCPPIFPVPFSPNEDAAREHFEALNRPNGLICPKRGAINEATSLPGKAQRVASIVPT